MKFKKVALIGNPNSGKTTLFNKLTRMNQRVGNWPGVTIEKKTGTFLYDDATITVTDTPGIYSIITSCEQNALDVQITRQFLDEGDFDLIVNIVDVTNFSRNLYLSLQLIELGLPVILACNFSDVTTKKGIQIDFKIISESLGVPIIPISAAKSKGLEKLKQCICEERNTYDKEFPEWLYELPRETHNSLLHLTESLINQIDEPKRALNLAALAVEGDAIARTKIKDQYNIEIFDTQLHDIHFAASRYAFIHQLMAQAWVQPTNLKHKFNLSYTLDKLVMNKWLGIPFFLLVIYSMFVFALNVAGTLQDSIDILTQFFFVEKLKSVAYFFNMPPFWVNLLTDGFGMGLSTIITFLPVIAGMYFYLTLLEDSGYMSRAVFVMDKCMRSLGLSGKSFLPLIIGFGCNVPGILATRTLEEKNERILTIMMSPFMSCGARLAIFTAFVAAFFPNGGGQNIVFLLYFIGVLVALATGIILKHGVLKKVHSPLVLELPPYRMPSILNALRKTYFRLKSFVLRAAKFIIPICMVIGTLNSLGTDGSFIPHQTNPNSILSSFGKKFTPLFKPIGIDEQNWPATVGLFTGMIAKEVVVSTLNTLYDDPVANSVKSDSADSTAQNSIAVENTDMLVTENSEIEKQDDSVKQIFLEAFATFIQHVKDIPFALIHPIKAAAPVDESQLSKSSMGKMVNYFDGRIGAFTYLLFILLYVPCISTVVAIAQELNWRWASVSIFWSTSLAYVLSAMVYQLAIFSTQPWRSTIMSASLAACLVLSLFTGIILLTRDKLITGKHMHRIPTVTVDV